MRAPGIVGICSLVAAVLVAGGVTAGLALAPQAEPSSVRGASPAASAPVSTQEFDDARQVRATPQVTDEAELALSDAGRVTASACVVGGTIESGASPVTVDDRPVLALATGLPLWRDLARGARGDDVEALQVELARLGHPVTPDGVYGPATVAGVQQLFRDAGVARPTGALPVASVLWLPAPSVTVEGCTAPVGATVAAGEPFVTVAGTLASLRVEVPANLTGGDRVLRHGDDVAAVGEDGVVTDADFLASVREGSEFLVWQWNEGTDALTLELVLADPLEVTVVPPGALFALDGDSGCVRSDGVAHPVRVVASSLGQTLVVTDGAPLTTVDTTPQADGQQCG